MSNAMGYHDGTKGLKWLDGNASSLGRELEMASAYSSEIWSSSGSSGITLYNVTKEEMVILFLYF